MALTEDTFIQKMDKLTNTQQSIEVTSGWCALWRSHAHHLAQWWESYFSRSNQQKRLSLLFLANDVLQTSRKKGPEFVAEFYKVLPRALRHFLSKADEPSRTAVHKLMRVWQERRVFGSSGAKVLQEIMQETHAEAPASGPLTGHSTPSSALASPSAAPSHPVQPPAVPMALRSVSPTSTAAGLPDLLAAAEQRAQQTAQLATALPSLDVTQPQQLAAARAAVGQFQATLAEEQHARLAALAALQAALQQQQAALHVTETALQSCAQRLSELDAQAQHGANPAAAAAAAAAAPQPPAAAAPAPPSDAAAIAAQLIHNPQALLEALASLPKGVSLFAGLNGGAGGGHAQAAEEEEYDPEAGP